MIAVALVAVHKDFHIDIGTSTWLVSSFYLTGAVGPRTAAALYLRDRPDDP